MKKGKRARTAKKSQPISVRASELEDPRSYSAAEAAAWANVEGLANSALKFWNSFLGLMSGSSPLDATGFSRLTTIIRAVSWVESRHATGAGDSSAVDPMQCANPRDAWWKELTYSSSPQDRFVRGPGLTPNYNACDLPDAAASDASFPTAASLSNLSSKTAGHDDAGFVRLMSYAWGIPFLIYKINKTAGDNAFQCEDLSRSRLVDGAVAYNGGCDRNYRQKINSTIDMIGGGLRPKNSAEMM